jgi:glutamate synthase (NADPH) large chain
MPFSALPAAQGLYDPQSERDACGLAMVADLRGRPTHGTVTQALAALHNLRHRGAAGAEPSSGDGSGLLMQVPDAFYRAVAGVQLPPPGEYATGSRRSPRSSPRRSGCPSSAGGRCRPTRPASARPPAR